MFETIVKKMLPGSFKERVKKSMIFQSIWKRKNNVYNTNLRKNALLSYIVYPFSKNIKNIYSHTNIVEVEVIAEVLKEYGYNVDVISFDFFNAKVDYSKYDLIFGFGEPFEKSFYSLLKKNAKRIFYGTGAHVCFQNHAELHRIISLRKRKGEGIFISPRRKVERTWSCSTTLADAIILLGNKWTSSTYEKYYEGKIYTIPVSSYNFFPPQKLNRKYENAKYNFLWIGSSGLVHKGLDLCLDAFSKSVLDLHICGPKEDDFFNIYKNELADSNIHYHGFVDISSEKFKNIVEKCAFVIFPTCSEGQATSLITAMYTGLIPIATKESGVDIRKFGFLIEEPSVEQIEKIIREVSQISEKRLNELSMLAYDYCKHTHNIEHFKNKLTETLNKIGI